MTDDPVLERIRARMAAPRADLPHPEANTPDGRRLDLYRCDRCHGFLCVEILDEGIVEPVIVCCATSPCDGQMRRAGTSPDLWPSTAPREPSAAWYRPTPSEIGAIGRREAGGGYRAGRTAFFRRLADGGLILKHLPPPRDRFAEAVERYQAVRAEYERATAAWEAGGRIGPRPPRPIPPHRPGRGIV